MKFRLRSTDFEEKIEGLWTGYLLSQSLWSFGNDDGNVNENIKKSHPIIKQNNNSARASRFFVHFFAVTARLRRENA